MKEILKFISKLEKNKISYNLACIRCDALMVQVNVPGEKWEIEFMDDGTIEIEKFKSDGKIFDEKELDVLFRDFSD